MWKNLKLFTLFFLLFISIESCTIKSIDVPKVMENANYPGNSDMSFDVWALSAVVSPGDDYNPIKFGFYTPFPFNGIDITISGPGFYKYSFQESDYGQSGNFLWYGTDKDPSEDLNDPTKIEYGNKQPEGFYRAEFNLWPRFSDYRVIERTWFYLSRNANLTVGASSDDDLPGDNFSGLVVEPNCDPDVTYVYTIKLFWLGGGSDDSVNITTSIYSEYGSGGHNHTVPTGTIAPTSTIGGGNGTVFFEYTPPAYGGRETLFFDVFYKKCHNVAGLRIDIKNQDADDFQKLPIDGTGYLSSGGTASHLGPTAVSGNPDARPIDFNHWGVAGFVDFLPGLGVSFNNQFKQLLHFNDMSLPYGGKFHTEMYSGNEDHDKGTSCDTWYDGIGNLDDADDSRYKTIKIIINNNNPSGGIHDERNKPGIKPHLHLMWNNGGVNN